MIEIFIILFLSAAICFSFFYIRYLIKQIKSVTGDFILIREMISKHGESLKNIYEAEMFYGEPILQSLVEETRDLVKDLNTIIDSYEYEGDVDSLEEEIDN